MEEFLNSTGRRDFEQLSRSLDEACDSFAYIVYPASMGRSSPTPPNFHKAIQSDLRVRKIYEQLKRMPLEKAGSYVKATFDDYFEQYQGKWSGKTTILPESNHYSVAASMFLCAEFADDAAVIARIDDWSGWYFANQGRSEHFDERARILPLFLMNTYCSLLVRNGTDLESINAMIKELEDLTKLSATVRHEPLAAWDSARGRTDVIGRMTIVPSWSHRIRLKPDLYDELNASLRSAIENG